MIIAYLEIPSEFPLVRSIFVNLVLANATEPYTNTLRSITPNLLRRGFVFHSNSEKFAYSNSEIYSVRNLTLVEFNTQTDSYSNGFLSLFAELFAEKLTQLAKCDYSCFNALSKTCLLYSVVKKRNNVYNQC